MADQYVIHYYQDDQAAGVETVLGARLAILKTDRWIAGQSFRSAHIFKAGSTHGLYIARHTDPERASVADRVQRLTTREFL